MADYPEAKETGGLSGPPLMESSTAVLAEMYKLTGHGAYCAYQYLQSCDKIVEMYSLCCEFERAACLAGAGFAIFWVVVA